MVTTKLFLDTRKGEGLYPLKLRLTYKRKTAYIVLNIKLEKHQWDGIRVVKHPRALLLNNQIATRKAEIDNQLYQWATDGELAGRDVTTIKTMLERDADEVDFLTYWRKAVARRTPHTQKVYEAALSILLEYDARPAFDKIDLDWLIGFDNFMARTLKTNTRSIRMRCLRAVLNDAMDDEVISRYPFRKFKIKQEETPKKALSLEDMHKLMAYPVEDAYEDRYKDIFLLMVLMRGINIGDLCLLKHSDMVDGRIIYHRRKTHKTYSIKVEPEIRALLEKYKGEKYLLNIMDTYMHYEDFKKRLNLALKRFGDTTYGKYGRKSVTSLWPGISTNWARHTFATIARNECEISDELISDLMGHSKGLEVTNIYIKKDIDKMDTAARKVIDKVMYGK